MAKHRINRRNKSSSEKAAQKSITDNAPAKTIFLSFFVKSKFILGARLNARLQREHWRPAGSRCYEVFILFELSFSLLLDTIQHLSALFGE